MSNMISVVPSAEGPPTHGHKDKLTVEELWQTQRAQQRVIQALWRLVRW
jgi:hypothetical protein